MTGRLSSFLTVLAVLVLLAVVAGAAAGAGGGVEAGYTDTTGESSVLVGDTDWPPAGAVAGADTAADNRSGNDSSPDEGAESSADPPNATDTVAVGVVDDAGDHGPNIVDTLTEELGSEYEVTLTASSTVVDNPDQYDVLVVQKILIPGPFVDATDTTDIGVVYLDQWDTESNGIPQYASVSDKVVDTGDGLGDGGPYYDVVESHPILDGFDVGEEVLLHTGDQEDASWFDTSETSSFGTLADVRTDEPTGEGLAVDEETATVLASSLGRQDFVTDDSFTTAADQILAQTVTYLAGGGPVTVDIEQSADTVGVGEAVTFTATNLDDSVETVEWTFGDGATATGESVTHGYDDPGEYTVEATATAPGGTATATTTVTVEEEGATGFDIEQSADAVGIGEAVTFTATNLDDSVETVEWTFGDGATATGESVTHGYDDSGEYTVEATATASGGTTTATTTVTVTDGLGFTASPDDPKAGETVAFEALNYEDDMSLQWEFGDGLSTIGAATVTHSYDSPGTYEVTLTESGGGSFTQTIEVEQDEESPVVNDVAVSGLQVPVITGAEDERYLTVTVETVEEQSIGSVTVDIAGETSSLEATDSSGTTRTWGGPVDVSGVTDPTEATITIADPADSTHTTSRQVDTVSIDWVELLFSDPVEEILDPEEESTAGEYSVGIEVVDTSVVIDKSPSPQWDEDINVTLEAGANLTVDLTDSEIGVGARVAGAAGVAGVTAGGSINPELTFNSDLEVTGLTLTTSVFLQRDIFQQEVGLSQFYPPGTPDWVPDCGVNAGANIKGEVTQTTTFDGGLDPFEDISTLGVTAGPTVNIGGGGNCGPVFGQVGASPTLQAGVVFGAELPPEYEGSGVMADFTVNAEGGIDLWFGNLSLTGSVSLFDASFVDGQNPFTSDGITFRRGPTPQPSARPTPKPAHRPVPLSDVASVRADPGATATGLTPTTAPDSVVRLTERPFDDTDPALAPAIGGEGTLLWASEPASTGTMEPTNLRAQTGSGADWSESVEVTNNSHYAAVPDLATDDDDGLAAWAQIQNVSENFDDVDSLLTHFELAVAPTTDADDPAAWGDPLRLTDGDAYEYAPEVLALGGDEWLVVWDRNTEANISNPDAEEVGYALVSTADGTPTVETQGTIDDGRVPAVADPTGTDREVMVAFHRPNETLGDGSVVQGTLDVDSGAFEQIAAHGVTGFDGLAAAGDKVVWADGPVGAPQLTGADQTGATTQLPLQANTSQVGDLALDTSGDRSVLTYRAKSPRSENFSQDLAYQVALNGTWSNESQLVRSTVENTTLLLDHPAPLVTDDSAAVAFSATGQDNDTSEDLFFAERPFEPTYDLAVDAPESAAVGDEIAIEATVTNAAVDGATDPAVVEVRDGESVLTTGEVGPLGPGETGTVTLTPTVPASGDLVVALEGADPATDDGPLQKTAQLTLASAGLAFGEVDVSRPEAELLQAEVTVTNAAGAATSDPVTVAIEDNGTTLATGTAGTLAGGEETTVTLTVDPAELTPGVAETLVLDPDSALPSEDIQQATTATWVGQPNLVVSDTTEYGKLPGDVDAVSLVVTNTGPVGTTATVSAVDQAGDGEVVGSVDLDLPAAVDGTTVARQVTLPVESLEPGEEVLLTTDPDRPDSDVSTGGIWDTVEAFTLEPVVDNSQPTDVDGDGLYEDVDGDGSFDIFDVQAFFENFDGSAVQNEAWAYDFDEDGGVDIFDVQALFEGL